MSRWYIADRVPDSRHEEIALNVARVPGLVRERVASRSRDVGPVWSTAGIERGALIAFISLTA